MRTVQLPSWSVGSFGAGITTPQGLARDGSAMYLADASTMDPSQVVGILFTLLQMTAFGLLIGGSAGVFVAILFFGSGLLWAPFAAWLTYREASSWGVPSKRYALLGGVYSLLCIFLWLNMMTGMRKANWNRFKNGTLYIVLFLIWFGLLFIPALHLLLESLRSPADYSRPTPPWIFTTIGLSILIMIAWLASAVTVWDRRVSILANEGPWIPQTGLWPFGLALMSTVAVIMLVILVDVPIITPYDIIQRNP